MFQNVFTRQKDPIQFRHRLQQVDLLVYRQLLGDISTQEVKEVNSVFGSSTGYLYTKCPVQSAHLMTWSKTPLALLWVFGASTACYTKFVRGYNILWFVAPFLPLWGMLLYDVARPPKQEIENALKYILAKRAATCELERNQGRLLGSEVAQTQEFKSL